ncbi:O-antigen ligase family protein [Paraglaciecola sp.]|uniref:O-antigen ligase family protein n=1 Tax=Paraglaciecola sp. TaxID=1920173 RepID=UPI003262ED20
MSLIIVAVTVSLLLVADQYFRFSFLDQYQRRSAFFMLEGRRIVLLKNEVIFGFIATVSLIINNKKGVLSNKFLLGITAMLFLVQAMIMESRMGFLAMGVACLTLLMLKGLTKKTFSLLTIAVVIIFTVFPIIFSKHIESLGNMTAHDDESNISIRFESTEHFYEIFKESYGLGFGTMSRTSESNNVLNQPPYNVVDIGAFSTLFQFGPLGLIMWIVFTLKSLVVFKRYYIKSSRTDPYSVAAFAFILGFTLSLLPLSFFTASWCIGMGGILLYLTWYYENKLKVTSTPTT